MTLLMVREDIGDGIDLGIPEDEKNGDVCCVCTYTVDKGRQCSRCIEGFICDNCITDACERGLAIRACPICRKPFNDVGVSQIPVQREERYDYADELCIILNKKYVKLPLAIIGFAITCFVLGWLQLVAMTGCNIGCIVIKPVTILMIFILGLFAILALGGLFIIIASCFVAAIALGAGRRT